MLRGAIAFFILGLLAMLLGANNVAGLSFEAGRLLLLVFLALALVSFLVGIVGGRRRSILGVLMITAGTAGLVGLASLTGCADVKNAADDVGGELKNGDLNKHWRESACAGNSILGVSSRTEYQFSGNDVMKVVQYFSNADCGELAATATYSGTYKTGEKNAENETPLDLSFDKVVVVAQNQAGANVLNTVKFCGGTDWKVAQPVDQTAQSKDTGCPLDDLPAARFDIFVIENNTLFLGKDGAAEQPSDRPADADREAPYTVVN